MREILAITGFCEACKSMFRAYGKAPEHVTVCPNCGEKMIIDQELKIDPLIPPGYFAGEWIPMAVPPEFTGDDIFLPPLPPFDFPSDEDE